MDVFPVHSPIMLNEGFIAAVSLLVLASSSSSSRAIELYWIHRTARPAVVNSHVQPCAAEGQKKMWWLYTVSFMLQNM